MFYDIMIAISITMVGGLVVITGMLIYDACGRRRKEKIILLRLRDTQSFNVGDTVMLRSKFDFLPADRALVYSLSHKSHVVSVSFIDDDGVNWLLLNGSNGFFPAYWFAICEMHMDGSEYDEVMQAQSLMEEVR